MLIKRCKSNVTSIVLRKIVKGGFKMGVSMGIVQPMTGKVAEEFLRDSEKSTITKETIKKCRELAKMTTKRY